MTLQLLTAQAEDAHRAATSDREQAADLILKLAVKDAIDWCRAGKPGRATYRLERALMSANRILGTSQGATR